MKKNLRHKIAHVVFLNEFRNKFSKGGVVPFDQATSIGIIYDSSNEAHYDIVRKYVKELRETHHKDVLALGYYDQKELPTLRFSKLGLDFLSTISKMCPIIIIAGNHEEWMLFAPVQI